MQGSNHDGGINDLNKIATKNKENYEIECRSSCSCYVLAYYNRTTNSFLEYALAHSIAIVTEYIVLLPKHV